MINLLKSLFKEKPKYDYPYEYCIINFTENSKKEGYFEDINKVVQHYEGNEVRSYPFTDELVETFQDNGVPVYDMTTEPFKLQIAKKINPQVIQYTKEGG